MARAEENEAWIQVAAAAHWKSSLDFSHLCYERAYGLVIEIGLIFDLFIASLVAKLGLAKRPFWLKGTRWDTWSDQPDERCVVVSSRTFPS